MPHDEATPRTALADLPTAEVVRRAQLGSLSCFAEVLRRYEGRLYNFLRRRSATAADAEDLAQETLLRAWRQLDRYDARWQFSTWLFTIAGRLAASQARRRRGAVAGRALDDLAGAEADPARRLSAAEEGRRLWAEAGRILSTEAHSALWLRYAEDLSIREIAEVLGRPTVTVRVMLFRARRELASAEGAKRRRDEGTEGRTGATERRSDRATKESGTLVAGEVEGEAGRHEPSGEDAPMPALDGGVTGGLR